MANDNGSNGVLAALVALLAVALVVVVVLWYNGDRNDADLEIDIGTDSAVPVQVESHLT